MLEPLATNASLFFRSEFSDSEAIKSAFLSVEANIAEDEKLVELVFYGCADIGSCIFVALSIV